MKFKKEGDTLNLVYKKIMTNFIRKISNLLEITYSIMSVQS